MYAETTLVQLGVRSRVSNFALQSAGKTRPLSPSHAKGDGKRRTPPGWCQSSCPTASPWPGLHHPPPTPQPHPPPPPQPPPLFVCKASRLGPKGTEGRRVGGVRLADDGRPLFNLDPLSFLVLLRPPPPPRLNSFERDAVLLECD